MKIDAVDVVVEAVGVQKGNEVRDKRLAIAQVRRIVDAAAHGAEHEDTRVFGLHRIVVFDIPIDVVLCIHGSTSFPIAVHFIANLPIANAVPLHDICIVYPGCRFLRRAGAHVDGDDGIRGWRERVHIGHERLEIEVGLRRVLTGGIGAGRCGGRLA